MKKIDRWSWAVLVFAAVVIAMWSVPCHAQSDSTAMAPAFSIQRVLVTAGLDAALYDDPITISGRKYEFKPSLNVAYNLGKYSSLVGSYSRGLTTDRNEYRAGIRIRLFNGAK